MSIGAGGDSRSRTRPDTAILRILAGPRAIRHIAAHGLQAADVSAVAGAAGGPKGLALIPLDRYVFGDWLPSRPRPRALFGASIGAWRMAAAAQRDPVAALDRLEQAYLELQRYPQAPSAALVSRVCRHVVRATLGGPAQAFLEAAHPDAHLHVVTARARTHGEHAPAARAPTAHTSAAHTSTAPTHAARTPRAHFARAAVANAVSRDRLGRHLQRVVFARSCDTQSEPPDEPGAAPGTHAVPHLSPAVPDDRFATRAVTLHAGNLEDALLASGSIPLVADPVRGIVDAPAGDYWDGGLIDYHLYWRYARLDGLVLYPHFVPWLTAGWLDKFLPWRRHGIGGAGRGWIDNLVLLAPGPDLLQRLPNRALPDRRDFHRHGLDHDGRLRAWRHAIGECARMAEAFARFVEHPDPGRIEAL